MNKCAYNQCHKEAKYYMCWLKDHALWCGRVCAQHDKLIGRQNLMKYMTLREAIKFEREKEE